MLYILIYFYNGDLPWKRDLPVLKEDILSNVEIQNVIDERDPFKLTQDMEPEFGMMLQYLQELSSRKKPNYKMLRS